MLGWLSKTDPSMNGIHIEVGEKFKSIPIEVGECKSNPGGWFVDSEEFDLWKSNPNGLIWLHGIHGCGKTILRYEQYDYCLSIVRSVPNNDLSNQLYLY